MQKYTMGDIKQVKKGRSVIVLFNRIGGNTIGYSLAGMDVRTVVNNDQDSNKIFCKNFDIKVIEKDIANVKGFELMRNARINKYDLDILDVFPPIDHGIKNHFKAHDTESIFMETTRILYEIMPKVTIFHLPKILALGENRLVLNEVIEMITESGYIVDFEILNGSYYEVPQIVEDLCVIGFRDDFNVKPIFPEITEKIFSTKDTIGDLINCESDISIESYVLNYLQRYFLSGCTPKNIKKTISQYEIDVESYNYRRDKWDEPYYALEQSLSRPFHPIKDRFLSIKEILRLQTFPEDYILSNNPNLNWIKLREQIPPMLIKYIAETIESQFFEKL